MNQKSTEVLKEIINRHNASVDNPSFYLVTVRSNNILDQEHLLFVNKESATEMERMLCQIYGRKFVSMLPMQVDLLPNNLIEAIEAMVSGKSIDEQFTLTNWLEKKQQEERLRKQQGQATYPAAATKGNES